MMQPLAEDRDRIADELSDIVVRRLFSAGLALEAALGLTGEHRAAGKVQDAISELDLAIRDIRDVVFDSCRPDWPAPGRSG
jgi:two-component system, NarL family, sensor histidine kinase DevS